MEKITEYIIRPTVTENGIVRAWQETIMLPTYEAGEEEKNPIFLEKRVYQGSSGAVYPYPVIEKIHDEKRDKPYIALFLENEYLKIMILPELGGRVQMAYDKIRKRHFVYYNQVIKPALVGLTGPWISGGIEFNWPQHHRPSTFKPTDYIIEEHPDGSRTVWCNEVERMSRTKGMQGFTLYPAKACLEIRVKIYNRTPFPQTFLWWANPAVAVNDDYRSVFPPDVHAVFDHGKRDVSNFPVATGVYYKQDYSAGVDISRYKNIPVPTSFMAVRSKYDFIGGYEDDAQAGLLHVADHHISTGKKQWTWGNGDFGQAWDRNLTDEDGPYIELMTGVYTDNQPDFSWLQPYEEKSWTQYFLPYTEAGCVKNATEDALVNVETKSGKTDIIVYVTSEQKGLNIILKDTENRVFLQQSADISPSGPYHISIDTGDKLPEELVFELYNGNGELLLSYQAEKPGIKPIPASAKAAGNPEDITSVERLFLTGQHLEQYRHATYNPMDYYREALRREPGDVRCNNAAGLWYLRRGQFAKAETYFRKAVATLTEYNPNPYDGEPYYNLGWSLKMQGRWDEACDAFYKSAWNAAWQDAAYLALAQISISKAAMSPVKSYAQSIDFLERSLIRNWHNHKSRHLKAVVLRMQGRQEAALSWIEDSLKMDTFNMGCRFEKYMLTGEKTVLTEMDNLMRGWEHAYMEYALDYAQSGLYEEAGRFLRECIRDENRVYPMVYYTLGYFASQTGDANKAKEYYEKASKMLPDRCFPNRIEEVNILQDAIRMNPSDAKALYYLGNFWYAARQYDEAVGNWEQSAALDSTFPTTLRNLALAYYNKRGDKKKAQQLLEQAFALDTSDARILMELDQLYKKTGVSPKERLAFLEKHSSIVEQRDDLFIERITLYNQSGEYEKAYRLIDLRKFHPWEGGEGKVTGQYVLCRVQLARKAIRDKQFDKALQFLKEAGVYPHHLGEGKLANAEENDVHYYMGVAYRGLGDEEKALEYFRKATRGASEPQQAFFYNDQQPDKIYYQGLAWRALGDEDKARGRFNKLVDYGKKHLFDDCKIDYFAVSLPDLAIWEDDLNKRNKINCYYLIGLGYLGLGDKEQSKSFFEQLKEEDVNHLGVLVYKDIR
jgi:tetratricopeptide (TPR) repeat protein